MKLSVFSAVALFLPLITATTFEIPVVPSQAPDPDQVNNCHASACATGYVCADDGTCLEDCHTTGCRPFHFCNKNGLCQLGQPPVKHKQCLTGEHYDPVTDSCIAITPRPPIIERVAAALPQTGKSPILALEAICHVSLNGASRCCSKSGDVCINGEVEKSDQHVIIPISHEL